MSTYSTIRHQTRKALPYANGSVLPTSGLTAGDTAFSTLGQDYYITNGTGWFRLDSVDENPTVSLNATTFTRGSAGGTVADITYTVNDDVTANSALTITVANSGIADTNDATVVHTTSNNHIKVTKVASTSKTFTITVSAQDSKSNTGQASANVVYSYTEELHQPAGTTRLLGLTFNGGAMGKTGSWGTPTTTGSPSYSNQTGGTLNGGYLSGTSASAYLTMGELANANSSNGKTFIVWYKGTQNNGTNSAYSPGIPFFGDTTGSVWCGFGLEDGVICVCGGGSATKGTTSMINGTWRMLAYVHKTNNNIDGYVDASGTMTKEITDKSVAGSTSYNRVSIIGAGYTYSGMTYPSALDAIQVYDGALTQAQIQAIFDKGG
jgi:hypothetical protein